MSLLEHYKRRRELRILALTRWTVENDVSNFTKIVEEAQEMFSVSRQTANSYANEVMKRLGRLNIKKFYCSI